MRMDDQSQDAQRKLKEANGRALDFVDKFMRTLDEDDRLGVVIRTHLAIERSLTELIRGRFAQPDYFDKLDLNYNRLVTTARAMELIAEHTYNGLVALGRLRNKVAHQWDYEITEQDQLDVINTVPAWATTPKPGMEPFSVKHRFKLAMLVLLHGIVKMQEWLEVADEHKRG